MSFLTFLRDVGKFARVGTMLAKDSVSMRQRKLLEAELPKCLRYYWIMMAARIFGWVFCELGDGERWSTYEARMHMYMHACMPAGAYAHGE